MPPRRKAHGGIYATLTAYLLVAPCMGLIVAIPLSACQHSSRAPLISFTQYRCNKASPTAIVLQQNGYQPPCTEKAAMLADLALASTTALNLKPAHITPPNCRASPPRLRQPRHRGGGAVFPSAAMSDPRVGGRRLGADAGAMPDVAQVRREPGLHQQLHGAQG